MGYDDYEETAAATSKFNSGMLINLRLNNLWILTHNYARKGQYSDWSAVLDRIWCELSADVPETKDGEKTNAGFYAIEEKLNTVGVTNWGKSNGFEAHDTASKSIQTRQYRILMEKEIFLRKLQNKQGKGTAYYDESEDDWE